MSESLKTVQPIQELSTQQKYVNVCTQLGDTAYRVGLAERQLETLKKQHAALMVEAEKLQIAAAQAQQAAAQKAVEKPAAENTSGNDKGSV